jgi:hypothetical protein
LNTPEKESPEAVIPPESLVPNTEKPVEGAVIPTPDLIDWDLVNKLTIKDSIVSRKNIDLDGIKPLEVRIFENKTYIGIPRNFNELMKLHYILVLYSYAIKAKDYILVNVEKDLTGLSKMSDQQTAYLHGFGLHLVNHKLMPARKDQKGSFKQGLYAGAMKIVGAQKDLDTRWFKFVGKESPIVALFGVNWDVKVQLEKRLMDDIMSVYPRIKVGEEVLTYIRKPDMIKKDIGLTAKLHKNKVLSVEEQEALSQDYKVYIHECNLDFPKFGSFDDIINFQVKCKEILKRGRPYKDRISAAVDKRLNFLYSDKKQKKKKVPVQQLIEQKRKTKEFINTFMPWDTMGLRAYSIVTIPSTDKDLESLKKQLDDYRIASLRANADQGRVNFLINFVLTNIGE